MKAIKAKNMYKNSPVTPVSVPVIAIECGNNVSCEALVDTGSSVNILSKDFLNKLIHSKNVKKVTSTTVQCVSASNNNLKLLGQCRVKIKIGHFSWKANFVIAKDFSWNMLLGVPFIKHSLMQINLHENNVF